VASRLARAFFDRDTVLVARELLGKVMVSTLGGVRVSGRIVECEAYVRGDSTSHAFRGRTARNASMFARPGTLYVYFTYGMHFCANLVTESVGVPTAVLIRALEPVEGIETIAARRGGMRTRDLLRGPARLCVGLSIARAADGIDTCSRDARVFIEDSPAIPNGRVSKSARVGVVGAPRDVRAARRFYVRDSEFVSNGPR
jgi:DNA-3-methyladenine glycosylase